MRKYIIDCSWQMYGNVEVEANSLEEAIEKVETETELSNINAEYLSDSFQIDTAAVVHEDSSFEECCTKSEYHITRSRGKAQK